jgi:hypothetical protein
MDFGVLSGFRVTERARGSMTGFGPEAEIEMTTEQTTSIKSSVEISGVEKD